MKRTYKAFAYQMSHHDPRALTGDDVALAGNLFFSTSSTHNWSRVGEATITVDLIDPDEAIQAAVSQLRRAAANERAEGERKAHYIEEQISKLLCIANDVEVLG